MRLAALVLAAAAANPAAAQGKPPCDAQAPGYDNHVVKCALNTTGTAKRYRFKASFSGSHDDTTASMTTTLDGAPLACDKGSKTELMGEDGEVSLDCRFAIEGQAGAKHLLAVTLSWRHAQYKDFELARIDP